MLLLKVATPTLKTKKINYAQRSAKYWFLCDESHLPAELGVLAGRGARAGAAHTVEQLGRMLHLLPGRDGEPGPGA